MRRYKLTVRLTERERLELEEQLPKDETISIYVRKLILESKKGNSRGVKAKD